MQPIIKDITEISDSREMYESKPHPFLGIFIYIVLACIMTALIWMYFGEVDIVSKGYGVVRPNENVSMIRNKVQGEVTYSALEEGKDVKKGDILFSIDCEDLEIKRLQMSEIVAEKELKLNQLKKFRDSIINGENLFSEMDEKEYYDRYIKFVQDFEVLKNDTHISSKNEKISMQQTYASKSIYENKIIEYNNLLDELGTFKKSIVACENVFADKKSANSLAYDIYRLKLIELEQDIADKKANYNLNILLDKENLIAKKTLEDSKISYDLAVNSLNNYKTTVLKQIEEQIAEITDLKLNTEQELSKLIVDNELLNMSKEQRELGLEKYKTDTLVSLYNQIDEMELSYKSSKKDLESIEYSIRESTVISPIDGKINLTNDINVGDLISVGIDIATIIPVNDNMYKVEIFMPNSEIANIEVGNLIKYRFEALPYKEYGSLNGYIINISTDAKVNQNVSGYYLQGSIENKTMYSYKNKPAEIKIGMTCEAHAVTVQKKILFYLLEEINLMD